MYIDFHKYNYELVDDSDEDLYLERDKKAYQVILQKWLDQHIVEITDRKWEIEEIQYLPEVSDFIKLIKESETLYELGFYTSCIALVGVSAEDFSKYLSIKAGLNDHVDLTQCNRLIKQLDEGIIDRTAYDLLNDIRRVRNDCLHYNQDFKRKNDNQLKSDAIKSLNNLKSTLKVLLGLPNETNADNFLDVLFIGLLTKRLT